MGQVATTESARSSRGRGARLTGGLAVALTALLALAACTSPGAPTGTKTVTVAPGGETNVATSTPPSETPPSTPAAPAAVITTNVRSGAISPTQPVSVSIANGTLTSVRMTNPAGKVVSGKLATDAKSWTTTEDLGYSKTYRISATGKNADGVVVSKQDKVTTLTPDNMTMPYIEDIYGTVIDSKQKYGVGMVVRVHFDESVNRAEAQRTLSVKTSPQVVGGWYWDDDQNVYWRPKSYYQPGTKVSVTAKVYGKKVGAGLYGQADQSASFTIGAKHVSIANAKTHHVKVYFNDKLVRTMATSMGRGGTVQGKNGPIYLWTMPGTYTVINHENPAIMSSDSYGLPANSPAGYAPEKVYWSTKISTDGIYLHELDATVWAQGNTNVSHGCLNMNYKNAKWFYQTSQIGDIVQVVHSGGPALQFWQGGQWGVPWSQWLKGSAL
jgi:lipoprotein-anchoring transpeptidase ErfK/SrfK